MRGLDIAPGQGDRQRIGRADPDPIRADFCVTALQDQHGVAKAVEAVTLLHGLPVGAEDQVAPGKS